MQFHHIAYATKRSVWFPLFVAPVFLVIAFVRGGGWVDFFFGMTPIILIAVGLFLYFLLKTQRRK